MLIPVSTHCNLTLYLRFFAWFVVDCGVAGGPRSPPAVLEWYSPLSGVEQESEENPSRAAMCPRR